MCSRDQTIASLKDLGISGDAHYGQAVSRVMTPLTPSLFAWEQCREPQDSTAHKASQEIVPGLGVLLSLSRDWQAVLQVFPMG